MLSFERAQEELTVIADAIPYEIYRELNGGIILLPEVKMHPENVAKDLYILGQYNYDPNGFGRYITIYYGSFCRVFGYLSDDMFVEEMKNTLYHELTHHLEHLAGDNSLEVQDEIDMARYKHGHENQFIL